MTPTELKDLFRVDVRDEAQPPLWSDVEIFSYIDDAEKMFCRETGGISDSTSPLCSIAVPAGAEAVAYDPRILALRNAYRQSDGRDISILNFEDLMRPEASPGGIKFGTSPTLINAVVVGMDANKLRLTAPAQFADTIRTIVYRMPLEPVTPTSTAFEIDSHHHRHLLSWVKHLAHEKQDAETYDRGRSAEFRQKFLEYCSQAKAERTRREHKYRTVAYGGL